MFLQSLLLLIADPAGTNSPSAGSTGPAKLAEACDQSSHMSGRYFLGEYAYFERSGCGERFRIMTRADTVGIDRFFAQVREANSRGLPYIEVELVGSPSAVQGRLGGPVFEVAEVLTAQLPR